MTTDVQTSNSKLDAVKWIVVVALVLLVISYNTEAATCSECNSAIRKVWHSETVGQLRYVGPLYVCSKCKAFESHMYLSD